MSYVDNNGTRIYYESEGTGTPILLIHGMFGTGKDWREQDYLKALRYDYRLIMIDVRGHGRSDKPHDAESYSESILVSDLVAVLDGLNISKAHYLGYSMGGWIGFAAAKNAPERFLSFMIGGAQPYADKPGHTPNPIPSLQESGMQGIVNWFDTTIRLSDEHKAALLANDVEAIIALATNGRSDFRDILADISAPTLVYCGDQDNRHEAAHACVEEIPNAIFVSLPGYDHLNVMFHGQADIIPHIQNFLKSI